MIIFIKSFLKYIFYSYFKRNLKEVHSLYNKSDESDKFKHLMEAVNYIRVAGIEGDLMEFGCHSGRTFSILLNSLEYFKMNDRKLHAFDSFEGLPKEISDDEPYFKPGMFATTLSDFLKIVKAKTGKIVDSNLIHVGFYSKTLLPESIMFNSPIALVHIDVDLYSSTVPILNFIENHLSDGAILLFDDYYCHKPNSLLGERKAFDEWILNNQIVNVTFWKNYSTFGASFILSKKL